MTTAVVIVAAGQGLRLGGPVPKQYQMLGGRAILARSVSAALGSGAGRVLVAIDGQARPLYEAAMAGIDDPRLDDHLARKLDIADQEGVKGLRPPIRLLGLESLRGPRP